MPQDAFIESARTPPPILSRPSREPARRHRLTAQGTAIKPRHPHAFATAQRHPGNPARPSTRCDRRFLCGRVLADRSFCIRGFARNRTATRPVQRQRYLLGDAGHVVANILSLSVGAVKIFGVMGDDPFDPRVRRLLKDHGGEVTALLLQAADRNTPDFIKPITAKYEEKENRISAASTRLRRKPPARF